VHGEKLHESLSDDGAWRHTMTSERERQRDERERERERERRERRERETRYHNEGYQRDGS
jgi:hypothetical protein